MPKLTDILAQLSKDVENGNTSPAAQPANLVVLKKPVQRLADAVADPMSKPFGWQTAAPEDFFTRGDPVGESPDLDRILALPRRAPLDQLSPETVEAIIELEMQKYGRDNPNCRCREIDPRKKTCVKRFLPAQAWALREISINQGMIASIVVGGGKCGCASVEVFDYKAGRRRSIAEQSHDLQVAAYEVEARKLATHQATAFASGEKPCVRFTLADGSSAEFSTDHQVMTHRGWVEAAKLRPGKDYVTAAVELPEPESWTQASDNEVKFVAYMLSDGGVSQATMSFTNADPSVIEDWSNCVEALGFGVSSKASTSKASQFNLRLDGGDGKLLRERWGLYGLAKNKRAHADIWGLPRRQVALFLNRFWACDGHIGTKSLECTLASEKLVDDLRFLLTRLGISSSKRYKKASYVEGGVRHEFDAWRIHIAGEAAHKFLIEVGDVLGKEKACQDLRSKLQSTARNSNIDLVPVGWDEMYEVLSELNIAKGDGRTAVRKFTGMTPGQYLSRSKFRAFCSQWGYTGKYAHLATTDVRWIPVASVEDIGVHPVYDLSVPGPTNFVANGIVVHNSLIDAIAPLALTDVRTVLLLIPASLRKQFQYDFLMFAEHFKVPNIRLHYGSERPVVTLPDYNPALPTLHVLPYSRLSLPNETDVMDRLNPDAIIADEADSARSMASARGRRLAKWYAGGTTPEEKLRRQTTKFVGMTGSLTDHSITEMNYLSLFALKERSPLPLDPQVVEEWGQCLDAVACPAPPGELMRFCEEGEDVRHAYRRRLSETPGFVIVNGGDIEVAGGTGTVELDVSERDAPDLPPIIKQALESVRGGVRPDTLVPGVEVDEQLEDMMAIARAAQEVSCGVIYYWDFPEKEPMDLRKLWLLRRRDLNREIREKSLEGETFLDSALLCTQAAQRFWGYAEKRADRPEWRCESYPAWLEIKDKVKPEPASYVLDDFLARDIVDWSQERPGIIWYSMKALALKIQELSGGLPIHDGGSKGEERLRREDGSRSIICSIQSNGRGRDGLQLVFDRQLVVNPPASATVWEQLLGRAHRRGQKSSVVSTEVYMHTPEVKKAVMQAIRRSKYVKDLLGGNQKLLFGLKGRLDSGDEE